MSARFFLDTNILVYAQDDRHPAKRDRCEALIADLAAKREGAISTQVMKEFFAAATRKLGLSAFAAKTVLQALRGLEIVQQTPELIFDAMDLVMTDRLAWWDSLLVASAAAAHCRVIYTEDLPSGQLIRGVRVVNPLA